MQLLTNLGPVHLLPKTDKWDYLQSPNIDFFFFVSCFDFLKVPRSPWNYNWNFFVIHFHFRTMWDNTLRCVLTYFLLEQLLYLLLQKKFQFVDNIHFHLFWPLVNIITLRWYKFSID